MGKKSDPPKVDKAAYGELQAASAEAAKMAAQNSADQLAWAKQTYAQDRALATPIIQAAMTRMGTQDMWAAADRARAQQFQGAEDRLLADAMSYDSPERKAQATASAMSDVYGAMEGSRQASQRTLEGFGVDPSSTRFGALDIAERANAAAAAVAAGNKAALQTEATARSLRTEAIGVGARNAAQSLQETQMAGQQGAGALAATLGTTASGAATMGTGLQWAGAEQGALGANQSAVQAEQQALNDRYAAKTAAASVLPNALGSVAGMAAGAYLGGPTSFLKPATAAEGGAIPRAMSPSGGKTVDDVPIMASAGEFVIPVDVVRRKGVDFFEKMIEGSRKPRGAVPMQHATA